MRSTVAHRSAAERRLDAATRTRWQVQAQIHSLRLLHRTILAEEVAAARVVIAQGGRVNPFEDPAAEYLPLRRDGWDFLLRDEAKLEEELRVMDRAQEITRTYANELGRAASEEAGEYSEESSRATEGPAPRAD